MEKVEPFRYLGRILAQGDEYVRAVRSQIKKARGTWARVGQVLQVDNTPPKVSAMFYKASVVYRFDTGSFSVSVLIYHILVLVSRYFGRYFVDCKIWRELHFVKFCGAPFCKFGGNFFHQKKGAEASFEGEKGVPAKVFRGKKGSRQFTIPKGTDQVFLRYRYGKYREIPTEYRPKIPKRYTTLYKAVAQSVLLNGS